MGYLVVYGTLGFGIGDGFFLLPWFGSDGVWRFGILDSSLK